MSDSKNLKQKWANTAHRKTLIKLERSHSCVKFLQGPLRVWGGGALDGRNPGSFCMVEESWRWCEITSCCYKPFGSQKRWDAEVKVWGKWEMKQAVRKEGGKHFGRTGKEEQKETQRHWRVATGWNPDKAGLETRRHGPFKAIVSSTRIIISLTLSQTAELNVRL